MNDCLTEETVAQFAGGLLKGEARAQVERHLDSCPTCLSLVARTVSAIFKAPAAVERVTPAQEGPPAADRPIHPGDTIGRYGIVGVIGAGGMGVVYEAHDPALQRNVALKVLKTELSASQKGRRTQLLGEAHAMAKLAHPNVVAVYDLGFHGEQLFIAMERVAGKTLRAWCEERPRTWREVVQVFTEAGKGLAAAHAAGIIHRDFKPENVLVADGRARVTDFGLAIRVEAESPAEVAGTLAYMAPEQIRGEEVDVRVDVFSFCAALYEALYGALPFEGQKTRGEPNPPPMRSRVPGWMRELVWRGLKGRKEERFPSMAALLQALGADPALKRRRVVAVVAPVAALVVMGLGGYQWLNARRHLCRGGPAKLAGVWDDALRARAAAAFNATGLPYATTVWSRVEKALDAYGGQWSQMYIDACEATRLRGEQSEEVLDLRMSCLSQRLSELRASSELFAAADKAVVAKATRVADGLAPVAGCADIDALRAPLPPPRDAATRAKVDQARDHLARVKVLERSGQYKDGILAADGAVAEAKAASYSPLTSEALVELGRLHMDSRHDADAEKTLQDAYFAGLGSRQEQAATDAATLLVFEVGANLKRVADAQLWARTAHALVERTPPGGPADARLAMSLGALNRAAGKFPDALAEYRRGLAIQEKALSVGDPALARAHNDIGNVLGGQGKLADALAEHQKALAIREAALGPEHPETANSHDSLGNALKDMGKYDDALTELHKGLAIREKVFGPDHVETASSHNNIGVVLYRQGKYEDALVEYHRALELREKGLGADHPDVAETRSNLALVLSDLGRYDDALTQYRLALATLEKALGPTHPGLCGVLNNIGETLHKQGKNAEALVSYRRGLDIQLKTRPESPVTAVSYVNIGNVLLDMQRFQEALEAESTGEALLEKAVGLHHEWTAIAIGGMGHAYLGLKQFSQAMTHYEKAITLLADKPAFASSTADYRFGTAKVVWESGGGKERALKLAQQAREGFMKPRLHKDELAQLDKWIAARGRAQ
jgi:tetratricopeptide (TPR) repeat protein